jgi:hypothetical protein
LGLDSNSPIVSFLKEILEDPKFEKIIHDAKMDADALYHLLGIRVTGCHDTQVWDKTMKYGQQLNLNNALRSYGLQPNAERDGNVYEVNVRFWATRPLTQYMTEWASGDVASLFLLRNAQVAAADRMGNDMKLRCAIKSEQNVNFLRDMQACEKDCILSEQIGAFIGRGGSNVNLLGGTEHFYQFRGRRGGGDIVVYSINDESMIRAKAKLGPYKRPYQRYYR